MRAPYFNLYENGHLCQGSFRLPDHVRVESIPTWESAFFDTHFSHTNIHAGKLCNHEHGHDALWRAMLKSKAQHFPLKYLAAMVIAGKEITIEAVMNE